VSGLNVVQSGVTGTQTSVFMRGSNSDHVLVIIDGIEMNDPSAPGGAFDFAHLLLDDIAQIEVLKGAQSVLYGADALGGVIYITTKKGKGNVKLKAKLEAGSNKTHHESVFASGSKGGFHYSAGIGLLKTEGDSIATESRLAAGDQQDDDGYDNVTASSQFGWSNDQFNSNFVARYIDSEVDIDGGFNFSGNTVNDPNAYNKSKQLYLGAQFGADFFAKQWQIALNISHTNIDRDNHNDSDSNSSTIDRTEYQGRKNKISLQNNFYFWDQHTLTLGLEREYERLSSDGDTNFGGFIISQLSKADRHTNAVFLQDQIDLADTVNLVIGVRHDNPNDTDSETTYRTTLNYQVVDNTRLTASYATGFKAPSLFQLYGYTPNNFGTAFTGNPNLDAETSKGWELGLVQQLWSDKAELTVTAFKTDIDDLITTVFLPTFDSTTINRDHAEIKGIESRFDIAATDKLAIQASHTFISAKDNNCAKLLRRPKHKSVMQLNYQLSNKTSFSATMLYTGHRDDLTGSGQRIKMGGYTLFNTGLNYQQSDSTRIYLNVENLTNKDYESAYGFQGNGLTALLGLQLTH
jgi:vitamin B12 transporter